MNNRYLILEDGSSYQGIGFGAPIIATGELAVETANFGYQESLTDQTNAGRILVFTTPIIGATGISAIDYESINPSVKASSSMIWLLRLLVVTLSKTWTNSSAKRISPVFIRLIPVILSKSLVHWTSKRLVSWIPMINMRLTRLRP